MTTDPAPRSEGLLGSLRDLGRTALLLLQTRLEILSTEVAEERIQLVRLLLVVLGILFCFQCGTLFAVLFVVLLAGEAHRIAAIGIAALVLLLAALGGVLWIRAWLKRRPPLFATTVAELKKDLERIRGNS